MFSSHVKQNHFFFQWTKIISMRWRRMFWHLIQPFMLIRINEIAGKSCPSTASQREVSPFIQLSVQMFNKPPHYTPYIQLSDSNTWRCLRGNQFVHFTKHCFNKILTTTNCPLKSRAMWAAGGNNHNEPENGDTPLHSMSRVCHFTNDEGL